MKDPKLAITSRTMEKGVEARKMMVRERKRKSDSNPENSAATQLSGQARWFKDESVYRKVIFTS
jgi:hypothetical protein